MVRVGVMFFRSCLFVISFRRSHAGNRIVHSSSSGEYLLSVLKKHRSHKSGLCFCCITLAKKNRYSRDIHEIDPQCDHEISCNTDFDLQRDSRRADTASRVDVERQLDIARYHMIELQINLMNFSTVTIFFGQGSINPLSAT